MSKRDSPLYWGQNRSEESITGRGEMGKTNYNNVRAVRESAPYSWGRKSPFLVVLWGTHCLPRYVIGSCSNIFLSSLLILLGRQGRVYFSQGKP